VLTFYLILSAVLPQSLKENEIDIWETCTGDKSITNLSCNNSLPSEFGDLAVKPMRNGKRVQNKDLGAEGQSDTYGFYSRG
jgi:hypothetical protein